MSGSDTDCYEGDHGIDKYIYNDTEEADIYKINQGFTIQPLDATLYGVDKARASKAKHNQQYNQRHQFQSTNYRTRNSNGMSDMFQSGQEGKTAENY